MAQDTMTLAQIQSKGLDLLARELGPVGLIRFLQQFDSGAGDYTAERDEWLGQPTVEDLAQELDNRLDSMTDEDIDLSDIPEITPEMFKRAVVRRPPKPDATEDQSPSPTGKQ
jgi:hypothetical protein